MCCRACYAEVDSRYGGVITGHDSITLMKNTDAPRGEEATMPSTTDNRIESDAAIAAQRESGQSVKAIAEQLGKSETFVRDSLKRHAKRAEQPTTPAEAEAITEAIEPSVDVTVKDEGDFVFLVATTPEGAAHLSDLNNGQPVAIGERFGYSGNETVLRKDLKGLRVGDDLGNPMWDLTGAEQSDAERRTDALLADPGFAYELLKGYTDEQLAEQLDAVRASDAPAKAKRTITTAIEHEQHVRSLPEPTPVADAPASKPARKREPRKPSGSNRRRTFKSKAGHENDSFKAGGPSFRKLVEKLQELQKAAEGKRGDDPAVVKRDAAIADARDAGWSFNDLSDALGRADNGTYPFRRLAAHNARKEAASKK